MNFQHSIEISSDRKKIFRSNIFCNLINQSMNEMKYYEIFFKIDGLFNLITIHSEDIQHIPKDDF